jgi:hypothetical protein
LLYLLKYAKIAVTGISGRDAIPYKTPEILAEGLTLLVTDKVLVGVTSSANE